MTQIKSDKAGTPIAFALTAGMGLGLAYGVIRTFEMGMWASIGSFLIVLLICYLIFTRGKASSYAQAQAWAQNEVDIAVEVYNQATAKAEALSLAYATAISSANAQATNNITIELPNGEKKTLTQTEFEGIINAQRDAQRDRISMGEFLPQESQTLWSSPNP
jgi:hypothetical protein